MSITPRYEIRRAKLRRRQWRVVLIGHNGEVLMVSEHLTSLDAAKTNIAAVRRASLTSHVTKVD